MSQQQLYNWEGNNTTIQNSGRMHPCRYHHSSMPVCRVTLQRAHSATGTLRNEKPDMCVCEGTGVNRNKERQHKWKRLEITKREAIRQKRDDTRKKEIDIDVFILILISFVCLPQGIYARTLVQFKVPQTWMSRWFALLAGAKHAASIL